MFTSICWLVLGLQPPPNGGDGDLAPALRKHWFNLRSAKATTAKLTFDFTPVPMWGIGKAEYSIARSKAGSSFTASADGESYKSNLAIAETKVLWRYFDKAVGDHVFSCMLAAPHKDAERWAKERGLLIHDWGAMERSTFLQLEATLSTAKSSRRIKPGNYDVDASIAGNLRVRLMPNVVEVVRKDAAVDRLLCRYSVDFNLQEGEIKRTIEALDALGKTRSGVVRHQVAESAFDFVKLVEDRLSPLVRTKPMTVAEARNHARRANLLFPVDGSRVLKAEGVGKQLTLWIKSGESEVVITQLGGGDAVPGELRRLAKSTRRAEPFEVLYVPPLGTTVGSTYFVKGSLWVFTLGDRFADSEFENLIRALEHPK